MGECIDQIIGNRPYKGRQGTFTVGALRMVHSVPLRAMSIAEIRLISCACVHDGGNA